MENILFQDFKTTVEHVYDSQTRFLRMYRFYAGVSKIMIILNLGSLGYSLAYPDRNYGLVLGLASFSLNSTFDFNKEKRILAKLVRMYTNHIIPKMKEIVHESVTQQNMQGPEEEYEAEAEGEGGKYLAYKARIETMVREQYCQSMGENFMSPDLDCVAILTCAIIYGIIGILVPVLH